MEILSEIIIREPNRHYKENERFKLFSEKATCKHFDRSLYYETSVDKVNEICLIPSEVRITDDDKMLALQGKEDEKVYRILIDSPNILIFQR